MKYIIYILITIKVLATYEDSWDNLLAKYTYAGSKEGIEVVLVDYQGIKGDAEFYSLLEEVDRVEVDRLTKDEKIAFYINLYNIAAIKVVVENYPLQSIKDVGSIFYPVWKRNAIKVGDEYYSLDYIEYKLLEPLLGNRMHFAIVCASISCPDLSNIAYRSTNYDELIEKQKRKFLDNEEKGVKVEGERVYISKIFKWFSNDFGNLHEYLELDTGLDINYLDYNWNLNDYKKE